MDDDPLIAYEDDPYTDKVHQPFTAWNQGWNAAEQGIPQSLNPYPQYSVTALFWDDGHEEYAEQYGN